jgi:bifunctional aspartokinase / homoserine dehydrogenase 1
MTIPVKGHAAGAGLPSRASDFFSEHFHPHRSPSGRLRSPEKKPLRVLKFGGTSVGDAACMERVIEIIRNAWRDSDVVVVVSAMGGVTTKLVAAASHAEEGNSKAVAAIFEEVRQQHDTAASALLLSSTERSRLDGKMTELLQAGDRLCQGTILLRELTPRTRDSISSLGERLSAPLVAAALAERGVASIAIDATELVVTDSRHGAADPCMDLTRERSQARLRPLLRQGIVPVVTGFIGGTRDGVLTTLGRGGSDYSATILGAVLEADEVIIWTDVDGLQTADPRLVKRACTIPEVSYREAAELAYFGAKVLHPKTLRAVMQCGIPLWIRNTFAPERPGTKITPAGVPSLGGVTALTALNDVAIITIGGPALAGAEDVLGRTIRTTSAVRADILLISQASSQNELCLVIPSALAMNTVEALRREFAHELAHAPTEHISLDPSVAMITVVGQNMRSVPGIVGRTFAALGRENVNVTAIAQGSSEFALSFVVAKQDVTAALTSLHGEFGLGSLSCQPGAEDEDYDRHCELVRVERLAIPEPLASAARNGGTDECVKQSLSLDSAYSDVQANR